AGCPASGARGARRGPRARAPGLRPRSAATAHGAGQTAPCLCATDLAGTLARVTPRSISRRELLGGGLALAATALLPSRPARAAVGDLDFTSAIDAAHAIRTGQISSVELTNRMLTRIGQYNPKLNAIVTLTPDAALARARAADEARAR